MALVNYADLLASIESWSHRDDVKDIIPDFVTICEAEMYANNDATLRLRSMEALDTSATNTSDRFLALPSDYLNTRRLDITVADVRRIITLKTPNDMVVDLTSSRAPAYYTITSQIEFDAQPDEAYITNLQYFKKLEALSDTNQTNAIMTNHPQIYLYGSLWALNQWSNDIEEQQKYYALFIQAIIGANNADKKGRYGVAPQQRVSGMTP